MYCSDFPLTIQCRFIKNYSDSYQSLPSQWYYLDSVAIYCSDLLYTTVQIASCELHRLISANTIQNDLCISVFTREMRPSSRMWQDVTHPLSFCAYYSQRGTNKYTPRLRKNSLGMDRTGRQPYPSTQRTWCERLLRQTDCRSDTIWWTGHPHICSCYANTRRCTF